MTPTEPAGEKAKCKAPECGAVIYWRPHPTTGKQHCFNPDGSSHWGTCPAAAKFRKPKGGRV